MKPTETWTKYEPHGESERPGLLDEFENPDTQFRRWEGSKRWEFTVPAKSIIYFISKLFRRIKKWT
jgi:hypothetical protein